MNETLTQGYALLVFLYAGIALGIIYDALRIIRLKFAGRIAGHLLDGVFVCALFLFLGIAFLLATGGELRLYGFLSAAFGAGLQQWAFGRWICKRIVKRRR